MSDRTRPLLPLPETLPLQELPSQTAAVATMRDWLERGEPGLAVLAGPPASGRTRVLEQLVLWLAERDDRAIGFPQSATGKRSDAGLLREAIGALGGTPAGRTGLELTRELREVVVEAARDTIPPLLLLDDANLTGSQLEILGAVFGGTGVDSSTPALQVLLAGPPELLDRIQRRPRLAGLVGAAVTLEGPTREETESLLEGWMAAARDVQPDLPTLSNGARASILQVAGTNPTIAFDLLVASLTSARRMGAQRIGAGLTDAVAASLGRGQDSREDARRLVDAPVTLPLPGLDGAVPTAGETRR